MEMKDFNSVFVHSNGIKYHCVTAGQGPLCLMLHGFPETRHSWRNQAPRLAERFQVVVPDMRGYGETDAPYEVAAYRLPALIDDVQGLIEAFGHKQAILVAHDWGGVVAVHYAQARPETVTRLVLSNAPHLGDYADLVIRKRNLRQMIKSWYVQMNQVPHLSEKLMAARDFALMERLVKQYAVRKEVFTPEVMAEWKDPLRRSGLRGGVNYYRASLWAIREHLADRLTNSLITCPVKVIWGEVDRALEIELGHAIETHTGAGFDFHLVKNCGHWVQQEAPDEYNRELLEFLDG